MANVSLKSIKFPGLDNTYTIPQIDNTLSQAGKAADAKAVGDAIDDVVDAIPQVDATLSTTGAAADAKVVGDEVSDLNGSLKNVQNGVGEVLTDKIISFDDWEQGNIRTTGSGTKIDPPADNRIRTPDRHALNGIYTISIADGYKWSFRKYSASLVPLTYTWNTGFMIFDAEEDYDYKFVLAKVDDTAISTSDLTASGFSIIKHTPDTTLTKTGVAADSKTVGDKFDVVNGCIKALGIDYNIGVSEWIQGSISNENGGNRTADNRCRSNGYMSFDNTMTNVKVTVKTGYKLVGRIFNSPEVTQPASAFVGNLFDNDWVSPGETSFEPVTGYYYRFVIALSGEHDNEDLAPADIDADAVSFRYTLLTDPTLTISGKAADAKETGVKISKLSEALNDDMFTAQLAKNDVLGNVTIRAVKTIYFSDGTPPHIEWYLLQDTENNFYISKDLMKKHFLFSYTPSSGSLSDWSCGIDKNNNVFFIKDAAGYDGETPRLDDAKRINPVYFLASEKYATQHTLDFGNELKPAGWLTSVGWLMLPDGNIIFCEYTRGTLKTCNVWHIDATDITDPENWEPTWSHDIIDTIDTTTPGVKHCHEVQYDFYTGICYFGTGDSDEGSLNYYSTDGGLTWTLLYGGDKNRCRRLNYIFTADKVYWASDSYETANHHFFIADRLESGLVDVENASEVALGWVNNQACYGCVYISEISLIVFMDRVDREGSTIRDLIFQGYDLLNDTVVTLGTIKHTGNDKHVGFRTKYVNFYPTSNCVQIGFNPASASVNPDTNQNAVCGNLGGTTGNGSTRVNNLLLYIYRKGNAFEFRFDSLYI